MLAVCCEGAGCCESGTGPRASVKGILLTSVCVRTSALWTQWPAVPTWRPCGLGDGCNCNLCQEMSGATCRHRPRIACSVLGILEIRRFGSISLLCLDLKIVFKCRTEVSLTYDELPGPYVLDYFVYIFLSPIFYLFFFSVYRTNFPAPLFFLFSSYLCPVVCVCVFKR